MPDICWDRCGEYNPCNRRKKRIKYEGTRAVLLCYAVIIPLLVAFVTVGLHTELNSMEIEYIFYMCFVAQCPTWWNVFVQVCWTVVKYLSPAFLVSMAAAIFVNVSHSR